MPKADFKTLLAKTWPARDVQKIGPFSFRSDCGGGARVSAATLDQKDFTLHDLAVVEAAFQSGGRPKLFQVWPEQESFDHILAERSYQICDKTLCLAAPIDVFPDPVSQQGFPSQRPTAVQREIWLEGGIGSERLEVMERGCSPKTTLLGRIGETPAGTCFISIYGSSAMVHAAQVRSNSQRQGVGRNMMAYAAEWAAAHGAKTVNVLVTEANNAARSLYSGLGMVEVGAYHYRKKA